MLRRLLSTAAAVLCFIPHLAFAQQLGFGIGFGLSPANISNPATGSGYAANDTITLQCTQPSVGAGLSFVPFSTSPVIKVLTVSTGAVATYSVITQGVTSGPFANVAVACAQASTSGSGTGATFNGQLVPIVGPTVQLSAAANSPVLTSCGTSPSVAAGSNSNAGQFTLGTATPTTCTVTFAVAYATQAYCTVSPASSGGAAITGGYYISAQSKTAFTLTIGTGTNSLAWNYTCSGN